MSNTKIYAYPMDKPFDLERLSHEIKASPVSSIIGTPKAYSGKILIEFPVYLTTDQETYLDEIISIHDGTIKSRTSKELRDKREEVLSELVDLAHNHPVLKVTPNEITGYLTSIDNWFNAWKRDGNHTQLVSKIVLDAQDTAHENYIFLNKVVNTDGVLNYQFLISYIPTTPYI